MSGTPFSLRPNIHLNVEFSSAALNSTQSTVYWAVDIYEVASQPSFSSFPADNTVTWNINGTPGGPINFTYTFAATGLQRITLASGSFVVNQQADGNGVTVSGSASVTAGVIGSASDSSSHTTGFIAPPTPSWSTGTTLSSATRGTSYSTSVSASPVTSYGLVSSSNTNGLSLATNGVISGTPTAVGTATFTVRAFNYSSSADRTFSITINPALPVFSDSTVATATRGTAYSDGVSASEAASYSLRNSANTGAGTLPGGLNFNTSTGAITGTPTTVQSIEFRVRATNVTGSTDTGILTLTVNPATPVFSDSTVAATAIVGTSYSDAVAASETASYSVRNPANTGAGILPEGLTLNTSTGTITGTPTTPGVFTFRIRATNVTGTADTGILTITVTSGARLWNGTTFVSGNTRAWNGTAFVSTTTRVWNGSSWVSAT